MAESQPGRRLAIVGGGWAGLAAAVRASQLGLRVSLFEMAPQLGGRARSLGDGEPGGQTMDNGQHILIGAYRDSLELMRSVGVDLDAVLLRQTLRLRYPDHEGLSLPAGPPVQAFARGVLKHRAWPVSTRLGLLVSAMGWALRGFRCDAELTVSALCSSMPAAVRHELIEPLCVAALNTPAGQASAQVFLRVLRDALFSGPGGSDLLLPRRPLSELLAAPAGTWLRQQGAELQLGRRVQAIEPQGSGWRLSMDGRPPADCDELLLACPAREAARLARPWNPAWSALAESLRYEPIITVYLHSPGSSLPAAMVALQETAEAPAQFAFDLGQLGHAPGRFAFVISGAARWVEAGLQPSGEAVRRQALHALRWQVPPTVLKVLAEKRATFACTPGLRRPQPQLAPGLWAAGDHVAGPYPATLEGAVRSGRTAVEALAGQLPR